MSHSPPRISSSHRAALHLICDRLGDAELVWAVTGSLGFALQGVPVAPHDIDLQTTAAGAYEIERYCAAFVTRPVCFASAERIQSHFGALAIAGLPVEIMGDIQKRLPNGSWGPPTDLLCHRCFVMLEGLRVPVLSLAYEAAAYHALCRHETAGLLERWLRTHPQ